MKHFFRVTRSKVHRLVEDADTTRFPLGRAKCAPFPRYPEDELLSPSEIQPTSDLCRMCR